jgi:hypothetical protein
MVLVIDWVCMLVSKKNEGMPTQPPGALLPLLMLKSTVARNGLEAR